MNARELSRYEVTQLRCGLPGPWQDLLPLMLAAVSENYVLVGEATRPSPPFTGLGSLFTPSPGAGADTGLRQRRASTPNPTWAFQKRREARFYAAPRSAPYRRYGLPMAMDRWSVMGETPRGLSDEDRQTIHRYQPRTAVSAEHWAVIRDFVIEVMEETIVYSIATPDTYMAAVARYVDWCRRVMGLALNREEIFDRDLIAYYAMSATEHLNRNAKGSLRSRLLWVGDHLIPGGIRPRTMERLGRVPATAPYRSDEVSGLKMWAAAQGTAYMRHACWTGLTFGLGAGLTSLELAHLRREDVQETEHGVIITITGGRSPREVAMLAEWEDYALVLARCVGPGAHIFKPDAPERSGAMAGYTYRRTKARPEGMQINLARMRITWMIRVLNAGCPVPVFLKVAGLNTMTGLEKIIPYLDDATAEESAALLRDYDAKRKARFRQENAEYCKTMRRERRKVRESFAEQVSQR